ncbi:amidohydrolase family protein [Acidobacteria bacterium AH-259-D05]|nr:amidohydrolase family protein [Acidobacteria bacterium AH-259-D05]
MQRIVSRLLLLFVVLVLSPLGYSQRSRSLEDLPPEVLAYPEIILLNGKILTVDEEFSVVEAVAIRGELILAVGDDDRILKMAGPQTQTIDLEGKTVVPGLIDTHDHLGSYAIAYMTLLDKGIQWEGKIETQALVWQDTDVALRDIKRAVEAMGFVPGSRAAFSHWTSKVPARAAELSRWPPARRRLLEALRYGWSVPNSHVHGDIGVRVFLDVIEEARIWGRDQKVSRQDALRMKTIWAAAYVGDKQKLGSIEAGKLADLVVLDGDYMSVPEDQISELEVILTMVGGKVAYSR